MRVFLKQNLDFKLVNASNTQTNAKNAAYRQHARYSTKPVASAAFASKATSETENTASKNRTRC